VVAPASPRARIALLASTNTWNAYNNFGGRSNHVNADRLPERPIVDARLGQDRYQNPILRPVHRRVRKNGHRGLEAGIGS
jgi:hypothetical protein